MNHPTELRPVGVCVCFGLPVVFISTVICVYTIDDDTSWCENVGNCNIFDQRIDRNLSQLPTCMEVCIKLNSDMI